MEIETHKNGATIRVFEIDEQGQTQVDSWVREFDAEHLSGLEELLYEVKDELGFIGSKYDQQRIEINVVHGSSYECTDSRCKICREGA